MTGYEAIIWMVVMGSWAIIGLMLDKLFRK